MIFILSFFFLAAISTRAARVNQPNYQIDRILKLFHFFSKRFKSELGWKPYSGTLTLSVNIVFFKNEASKALSMHALSMIS